MVVEHFVGPAAELVPSEPLHSKAMPAGSAPSASLDSASAAERSAGWPRSVYIHVPFCRHRCGYCDFTLVANRDHLIGQYLEHLSRELQTLCQPLPKPHHVQTIFIGGGTPTHLEPADLRELLLLISGWFQLIPGGEYSTEANPDGFCDQRRKVLMDAGVNRISLGVQSFDDAVLKNLERSHRGEEAARAVEEVARQFPNTSLDLIFGVPGQTRESWSETVRQAISLPVTHISTYGLTYEQGTAFFRRQQKGQLSRIADDLERDMYLAGIESLESSGFEHYEVSNFARKGYSCRHNQVYWNAGEYLAFGPGAARYVHGVRSTNSRSVVRWMNAWKTGTSAVEDEENLSLEDKAREAVMLALRMIRGLRISEFERRFGIPLNQLAGDVIAQHLRHATLEIQDDFLRLTRKGLMIADTVVSDFL